MRSSALLRHGPQVRIPPRSPFISTSLKLARFSRFPRQQCTVKSARPASPELLVSSSTPLEDTCWSHRDCRKFSNRLAAASIDGQGVLRIRIRIRHRSTTRPGNCPGSILKRGAALSMRPDTRLRYTFTATPQREVQLVRIAEGIMLERQACGPVQFTSS